MITDYNSSSSSHHHHPHQPGEPLPRTYPSEEYGSLILCGTMVNAGEAYCVVRKTGINTEVGGAQAEIMKDKTESKVSVFEQRVMDAVKVRVGRTFYNHSGTTFFFHYSLPSANLHVRQP